jgi:tetratricopeptide (TPR) repeat protein
MTVLVDRFLASCIVLGCLAAAAPDAEAAPDRAAADAAFDAGDTARALALYDEILAADPGDVNALLRSGKLLSWDRKYDEALARYDRALNRDPHNTEVELERAKVLLWSRRYDEAIRGFDGVLKTSPKEPWALCGTAQAYQWSGRGRDARPYYERALAAEPEMQEALLGLAYLDLEDGDTAMAQERANQLKKLKPGEPLVAELEAQIRRTRRPWVQIGWDGSTDSDDNTMNTYRAEGGFGIPAHMDLRFGYAHSDLHGPVFDNTSPPPVLVNPDGNASADTLYGVLGWQPKSRHRGELRLGVINFSDSTGGERTTGIGGVSYAFPMASWTGRAGLAHDPFLYSPEILDNEIDVTAVTFSASGLAAPRVQVEANAGYGDFSDGNGRWNADAGAWYVWKWPKRTLLAGGAVRTLGFTEDVDNGYFDPSHLIAALLSVRSNGAIGSSKWEYEAAVEAGAQSYTFNDADATGKPLWGLYGLVARPLPHGFSFQIFAGFNNSSTASGPGFTSRSAGVRLRYTIGG